MQTPIPFWCSLPRKPLGLALPCVSNALSFDGHKDRIAAVIIRLPGSSPGDAYALEEYEHWGYRCVVTGKVELEYPAVPPLHDTLLTLLCSAARISHSQFASYNPEQTPSFS